jgi:hypothetical protein
MLKEIILIHYSVNRKYYQFSNMAKTLELDFADCKISTYPGKIALENS